MVLIGKESAQLVDVVSELQGHRWSLSSTPIPTLRCPRTMRAESGFFVPHEGHLILGTRIPGLKCWTRPQLHQNDSHPGVCFL